MCVWYTPRLSLTQSLTHSLTLSLSLSPTTAATGYMCVANAHMLMYCTINVEYSKPEATSIYS